MNNSKTENTYRRLVIQPDPIIGYRFIPNLYSRINRPKNQFVIQTNDQGFRDNHSFEDLDKTKPTVLVLGDSYVAGDGLSNHERFTNLISNGLDVHIMNMGLPGSGTDQQLLIQERIASQFHYDVLVVVPFLHNLNRNMVSHMPMVDWATRRPVDVCKPYFCLNDEYELVLTIFQYH